MTTLYRPVLIESAEQADSLPPGTIATHSSGHGMDHAHKIGTLDSLVVDMGWASLAGPVTNGAMVGWTALVPIEAEEETVERHRLCREVPDVLHRFTTPWTLYTAKETP